MPRLRQALLDQTPLQQMALAWVLVWSARGSVQGLVPELGLEKGRMACLRW